MKQPKKQFISVRWLCGHQGKVVTSRNCEACRNQAKKKKRLERKARKEAQAVHVSRLPDGSSYQKKYDAAAEAWTVTLFVPIAGETKQFTATGKGSMRTEFVCDNLYREWLAAPK